MIGVLSNLAQAGVPFWYEGVSALDQYYKVMARPCFYVLVEGSLIDLAKIFPDLQYPGREQIDAVLESRSNPVIYFRCIDSYTLLQHSTNPLFSFLYNPIEERYVDLFHTYGMLRKKSIESDELFKTTGAEAVVLLARYGFQLPPDFYKTFQDKEERILDIAAQRDLLTLVLTGNHTAEGLHFLWESGFIKRHWPELAALGDVSHSKEYHPEGDVWAHTTETFSYRKDPDLAISLALLLHDIGKPHSQTQEGRRFDKHAEIGVEIASRFLHRLGFAESLISQVLFLVRNHMMPGALKTLPVYRVEKVLESDLFPQLLEVYRCDLSSTFQGPGGYYEACKIYRSFLKNKKNPFRTSEGKKIQRIREMPVRF